MTTYDFVSANKNKTMLLIAVFSAFVIAIGWLVDYEYAGGGVYLTIAVVYSLISAIGGYYAGDKVALASSGAVQIQQTDNPRLYRTVENLCITTGLPMPKVHVMDDPSINAFATGRDPQHASIAVTTGALQKLNDRELEGVIAHELSHVKNYDIRVMTVVVVLAGVIAVVANIAMRSSFWGFGGGRRRDDRNDGTSGILAILGIIFIIFAPIAAQLIKLAVSRRREYLADASGALITRFPEGLESALKKIQDDALPLQRASAATAHMYIANPFNGHTLMNLFSTHPPIEDRIDALEKMAHSPA